VVRLAWQLRLLSPNKTFPLLSSSGAILPRTRLAARDYCRRERKFQRAWRLFQFGTLTFEPNPSRPAIRLQTTLAGYLRRICGESPTRSTEWRMPQSTSKPVSKRLNSLPSRELAGILRDFPTSEPAGTKVNPLISRAFAAICSAHELEEQGIQIPCSEG